ncbi:trypsin-like peptidase domain-containing protein [bacterium]|nr:trypsin-like peptidase domain-containing protein [bacterium]
MARPHFQRTDPTPGLFLALALLSAIPCAARGSGPTPVVLDLALAPPSSVPVYRTRPLDEAALAAEDADREAAGEPYRFAVAEPVVLTPQSSGRWEQPTARHRVWRQRIVAPGALSLNLGFTRCELPAGAQLSIYPTDIAGPDDPRGVRVFTDRDNDGHGQLWTPVVLADDVIVELLLPWYAEDDFPLELGSVNVGYRYFGEDLRDKSGSCNIDVVCPQGDAWRREIDSVGVYTIAGTWKCTGALINNTREDAAPLFLTAHHCNNSMNTAAPSVVVYWNFQSPVCGQHGGGSLDDFQSGAVFRATSSASDFTLIEFDDPLDPEHGCTLAGWDRRDLAPRSVVGIHHPSTDEKSISFENDSTLITTYLTTASPGNADHLRVGDWDLGTTEPGSSGSPLFNPEHLIVGQLHGGYAACGNNLADWYGRLYTSWAGEGTPDTRLRDWLDPVGTGVETLSLLDPGNPEQAVTPTAGLAFSGIVGSDLTGLEGSYQISNIGINPIDFRVEPSVGWLTADPAEGTIPGESQVQVRIAVNAAASGLPAGVNTATVAFTNLTGGLGSTSRPVALTLLSGSPRIAALGPNPFSEFLEFTLILPGPGTYHARILDLRGMMVRDFGHRAAVAGENTLGWNAEDDRGRGQAAGTYILLVDAAGATLRASFTYSP